MKKATESQQKRLNDFVAEVRKIWSDVAIEYNNWPIDVATAEFQVRSVLAMMSCKDDMESMRTCDGERTATFCKKDDDIRKPSQRFDDSIASLTQERGESYGHPADDFKHAADLKAVVANCDDAVMRHAMEMICVKLARLIETPDHFDSWLDIAGYARTATMVMDTREDSRANDNPDGIIYDDK